MRRHFFQAFGVVVLLFNDALLLIAPPLTSRSHWPPSRVVIVGFGFIIGVGLLKLRKWAALYFSIPLFWIGLSWALSSIEPIPFPWNLLSMAVGVSLMLPLFVTIRVWSQLSWGGKWYF